MSKRDKTDRELQQALDELRDLNGKKPKQRNDLLEFFGGLLLLAAGLYLIFNSLTISSSWGYGVFRLGSFNVPNGAIFIPLFIGIIMLFLMERKVFGWIVCAVGVVIVLTAVIMSTRVTFRPTSGYVYVIMFGMALSGGALVVRQLFKKPRD